MALPFNPKALSTPPSTVFRTFPVEVPTKARAGIDSCGNKYQGLVQVKQAVREETAKVPFFFGFTDSQILPLLREATLELWEKASKEKRKEYFEGLQSSVKQDILEQIIPFSEEQLEALEECKGKTLIVRSSSNEDGLVVNAGGNLSVGGIIADPIALQAAIAEVVASYFSWDSLKNRSSGENPFTELPLCSVLVMEQITEKDEPIVSGVMMTHKPSWINPEEATISCLAASLGFGQGVVSGTIAADQWIMVDDEKSTAYSTLRNKTLRIIAGENGRVSMALNPVHLQQTPALNPKQIDRLHQACREIEAFSKQPMDVEFVFREEELYIVQARPVRAPTITSPTFIDPSTIRPDVPHFCGKTILPGSSEVISLPTEQILFASDIEEANRLYQPLKHRAILLSQEPENSNTHAEVNLASYSPPVLCFAFSLDEWKRAKTLLTDCWSTQKKYPVFMCPQTGLLVSTQRDLPTRAGLFVHPASFPLTVDSHRKGLQDPSTHPKILALHRLVTNTPEQMGSQLDQLEKTLQEFFIEMFSRSTCLGTFKETTEKLQSFANRIFSSIKNAAQENKPTLVAFHATALRQLITQVAPQVIGAHSLSGLESATQISADMEAFLTEFKGKATLCELAMMGRKAFDLSIQAHWLTFLRTLKQPLDNKRCADLLLQLTALDEIDQIPLWLSVHFNNSEHLPDLEKLMEMNLSNTPFLNQCRSFTERMDSAREQIMAIQNQESAEKAYEFLDILSRDMILVFAVHSKKDLLDKLQISQLLYELVQLWDLRVKTMVTSKIVPTMEDPLIQKQILRFSSFLEKLISNKLVTLSLAYQSDLYDVLRDIFSAYTTTEKKFSVQHWIVPRGDTTCSVSTNDDRLTILHQNALKSIGLPFSDITPILPSFLRFAAERVQKLHTGIAKRLAERNGIFASMTDNSASVIVNIPLNYHSFVIKLEQKRGEEKLKITADWRGSDNFRGGHLDFFEALEGLIGTFHIQSSVIVDQDLRITFKVQGEAEANRLIQAIADINVGSLSSVNEFRYLARALYEGSLEGKTYAEQARELQGYEKKIIDHIWKILEETGELNNLTFEKILEYDPAALKHLKERGLLPQIVEKMAAEFEGTSSTKYHKYFSFSLFESLSEERRKDIFWGNLMGLQKDMDSEAFPEELTRPLLERCKNERPEKYQSYLKKHRWLMRKLEENK